MGRFAKLLLLLFFLGCANDDDNKNSEEFPFLGEWKLIGFYESPGIAEEIVFEPVPEVIDSRIMFSSNGEVVSNSDLCNPFDNSQGSTQSTFEVTSFDSETYIINSGGCYGNIMTSLLFYIEEDHLILSFPNCFEPCYSQYERVE